MMTSRATSSAWSTATATGARERNEDTCAVHDTRNGPENGHCPVGLVCDGIGGHAYGEVAAEVAAVAFLEGYLTIPTAVPATERLRTGLQIANGSVRDRIEAEPRLHGMGTTITAAAVTPDGLSWIGAGDSPLMLWSAADGRLQTLNTRHNRPGAANQLTSAVMGGQIELIDAPAHTVPLRLGDAVIVASEGIDTLMADTIRHIAAADGEAEASTLAERLVSAVEAAKKPNQDNTTAACLRVGERHATREPASGQIEGIRNSANATVRIDGRRLDWETSPQVRNHSPTDIEWGYSGSGPAQLALAILLERSSRETAERLHQRFKDDFIARIRTAEWRLPVQTVDRWLCEQA